MRLVLEVAECCKADIDHVASSSNNGGDRWTAQERENGNEDTSDALNPREFASSIIVIDGDRTLPGGFKWISPPCSSLFSLFSS